MAETAAEKEEKKTPPPPVPPAYVVPHSPNERFPELTVKHPPLNLAADRKFAFALMSQKDVVECDSNFYLLPSVGQLFAKSIYRKIMNKNYSVALHAIREKAGSLMTAQYKRRAARAAAKRAKEEEAKKQKEEEAKKQKEGGAKEAKKEETKETKKEGTKEEKKEEKKETKKEEKKEEEKEEEKEERSKTIKMNKNDYVNVWFVYKSYFRADKLVMIDSFISMMTFLAKKASEEVRQTSAIDWMSAVPTATRNEASRMRLYKPISLARQPLNARCQQILPCRKRFANDFKDDRSFSPLCFGMRMEQILNSMRQCQLGMCRDYADKGTLIAEAVNRFKTENKLILEYRKRRIPTILMPLGHFAPFDMWTPPPPISFTEDKTSGLLTSIFFGKMRAFEILSEFHQFPANFPLHYFLLRVNPRLPKDGPLTFEMCTFPPIDNHRLTKTVVKYHYSGFQCRKLGKEEFLKAREISELSIRRSSYRNEVNPAVTFRGRIAMKAKDDLTKKGSKEELTKKGSKESLAKGEGVLVSQIFHYDEYGCESLGTISGWSTNSIASTATLSPGDFLYNWRSYTKPKESAPFKTDDKHFQNFHAWNPIEKMHYTSRLASEADERIIMINITESKKLCYHSKNQYFQKILEIDRKRRIRRLEQDEMRVLYVLNCLHVMEQEQDEMLEDALQCQMLEEAYHRLLRFYPQMDVDHCKGLDISPCWKAAVETGYIKDEKHPVLASLISSHDSWVESSPISESSRQWRCDKKPMEEKEKSLPALEMLWNVVLIVSIVVLLLLLSLEEPFFV